MTPIFNQRVEILRATRRESVYSSEAVEDWESPQIIAVPTLVSIQPLDSTEGDVQRPSTHQRFVMITPPGTDIPGLGPADRIRLGGLLDMDVVGQPARWPDPHHAGNVHHLEAILEVRDG